MLISTTDSYQCHFNFALGQLGIVAMNVNYQTSTLHMDNLQSRSMELQLQPPLHAHTIRSLRITAPAWDMDLCPPTGRMLLPQAS
jgi:hypothetical protein